MNRRDFVKMSPAFAGAAVTASLVLREQGKAPVDLPVSVLRIQPGDTVVLTVNDFLSPDTLRHIQQQIEAILPGAKAMILDRSIKLDGVLRQG